MYTRHGSTIDVSVRWNCHLINLLFIFNMFSFFMPLSSISHNRQFGSSSLARLSFAISVLYCRCLIAPLYNPETWNWNQTLYLVKKALNFVVQQAYFFPKKKVVKQFNSWKRRWMEVRVKGQCILSWNNVSRSHSEQEFCGLERLTKN